MSSGANRPNESGTYAVLTGGGTAGHVYPALAIAETLIESGRDPRALMFVGSRHGPESVLVPPTGLRLRVHALRGIHRSLAPRSLWWSLSALPLLIGATLSCCAMFRRESPRVVVSVGGYASMPAALAAWITRVPLVTCSYDLRPGLSTRLQARWARVTAVAYLPTSLPRAELTGAPVRESIRQCVRHGQSPRHRTDLGFPADLPLVVVVGGSLGSALLNGVADVLCARVGDGVSLLNLCGDRYFDPESENGQYRADGSLRCLRQARTADMAAIYAAADVVVMRAGASSIAEVSVVGVASVIVPWRDAADDHQTLNARLLGDHRAAVVVQEDGATVERVVLEVRRLLDDRDALDEMASRARAIGAVHRHPRFAEVIGAVAS